MQGAGVGNPVGNPVGNLVGLLVWFPVMVYDVTASATVSVVETHEMVTAPAPPLTARLLVIVNVVAPTAISPPTAVIVRTFPTDAAVCAPLFGAAAISTAASAVKMGAPYVHVIVLPTTSFVVMPSESAFEVTASPATREFNVAVPSVRAVPSVTSIATAVPTPVILPLHSMIDMWVLATLPHVTLHAVVTPTAPQTLAAELPKAVAVPSAPQSVPVIGVPMIAVLVNQQA